MPRKSKTDELREKFEAALHKGLESESAVERTAAIKATADMLNPNLTDLQKQVKQAEDAREAAEGALKTAQTALDAANAELTPLREQVAKFAPMETEYADLKANFDAKIAEARKELVEEAQQHEWKAVRAENAAKETLANAQSQYAARGQQILLDEVKRIIEENHIPEPVIETLPKGISPLFLTIWGNSPIRAQLMLSYSKTFPEPSEEYRQTLIRYLKATLPLQQFAGMEPPALVEHLHDKIEALRSLGQKWPGVLADIEQEFTQLQIERQADFLRTHTANMIAKEHDSALRGEGRTPISVKPASITGCPVSEHLPMCQCGVCSPGLKRPNSLDPIEETF